MVQTLGLNGVAKEALNLASPELGMEYAQALTNGDWVVISAA